MIQGASNRPLMCDVAQEEKKKMNDDMKTGYNICAQGLKEKVDTIIREVHRAYVNTASESAKQRLDAQIKILQTVKDAIKNAICDIAQKGE